MARRPVRVRPPMAMLDAAGCARCRSSRYLAADYGLNSIQRAPCEEGLETPQDGGETAPRPRCAQSPPRTRVHTLLKDCYTSEGLSVRGKYFNIWSQKVHTAKYSFVSAVGRARLGEPHASTLRVGPRWTAHTLPRPARNLSTLASLRTAPAPTAATRASPLPQQHPFFASAAACPFCPAITMPEPPGRGCGVFLGSLRAIATKSSFTLVAVFALVSMKKMPFSSAYCVASCGTQGHRGAHRSCLLGIHIKIIDRQAIDKAPRAEPSASRPNHSCYQPARLQRSGCLVFAARAPNSLPG